MKSLDIHHFERCLATLERALELLQAAVPDSLDGEMYRSACVKEFELLVELAGKLLKKRLRPYFSSNQEADRLTYEGVFRHAARFGLITIDVTERWLDYRDIRNQPVYEYGSDFADRTVATLPVFAADAHTVRQALAD